MNEGATPELSESPFGPVETPLIASRALGRLLGLEALHFRVESWQPSGSWLDRSAASLVADARVEGRTGLCVVGVDRWTVPLAIQCARAGLRCVIIEPAHADPAERGWLSALGVRFVAFEADTQALREAAPAAVEGTGLRLVTPDDALLQVGLSMLVQEVERAGQGESLLAVPGLTGWESRWLATIAARRSAAVPLPLDDMPSLQAARPFAVVGTLLSSVLPDGQRDASRASTDDTLVLSMNVSPRQADAARRLLAREEGLLASRSGVAGLAALVRALREDRARKTRERRLRGVTLAVVVLTGDPRGSGDGPPPESDAVPSRPVALAALASSLARLLVAPPGR